MTSPIRIATRASGLALWQANHVAERLRAVATRRSVELIHVTTTGDRNQTGALSQIGTLGLFTREVQKAVLDGRADLAVHSLKDLPTQETEGLVLAAVPERASMFDALVMPSSHAGAATLDGLPRGARVGTGSLRRRAQLLHLRPDLQLLEIRGNVDTRLRKLDEGQYDAIVLAEAGLRRLGFDARISAVLAPPVLLPAVSQGALGLECRADDSELRALLRHLDDRATHTCVTAERALLAELRAGCHAPLGVHTQQDGETLSLEAVVLSGDGRTRIIAQGRGERSDPTALARSVAADLRTQGAEALIAPTELRGGLNAEE